MVQKLLVVSDNHGSFSNLEYLLDYFKEEINGVVHCGDSEISPDQLEEMVGEYGIPVFMAKGNCDYGYDREPELQFEFGGHSCYVTHGHLQGVNWGDSELVDIALERGVDVVFYGHTHVPAHHNYEEDGVLVLNPGSISQPRQYPPQRSFAIVEFYENGDIQPHFYTL